MPLWLNVVAFEKRAQIIDRDGLPDDQLGLAAQLLEHHLDDLRFGKINAKPVAVIRLINKALALTF